MYAPWRLISFLIRARRECGSSRSCACPCAFARLNGASVALPTCALPISCLAPLGASWLHGGCDNTDQTTTEQNGRQVCAQPPRHTDAKLNIQVLKGEERVGMGGVVTVASPVRAINSNKNSRLEVAAKTRTHHAAQLGLGH